ncbi:hypothetical protein [Streptomyces qinzhouensis]|uniref:Uncharacterized protein n=1 Tax=Streptomyces qinzhouensis TaxID=2599401 RepID=A0A5B8IMI7_9ACTN|nr:hypothetical protein [Streptomyces qinzhouensis]QDY79812.1 hypothetical protein FQU76_28425 [Streptomyces qinzhouensis]
MTAVTIEIETERLFIVARPTEREANAALHQLAAVLRKSGLTGRYGVTVERLSGSLVPWAVYVVDRTPSEGAPDAWTRAVLTVALAD